MSTEANKALARRWAEAVNQGNLAALDELLAPTFVYHDPANPGIDSLEGYKQLLTRLRSAFPYLRFTIADLIGEADRVVARYQADGTHQGELFGLSPTGKQVVVTGVVMARGEGGKLVEGWVNWDTLGLLQQLGAVPAPGQAGR